jgi:hypothetical protein
MRWSWVTTLAGADIEDGEGEGKTTLAGADIEDGEGEGKTSRNDTRHSDT